MSEISEDRGLELLIQIRGGIVREREYQDKKWGTIKDHPHTFMEWVEIMIRELSEAREEWHKGTTVQLLREMLQVTATGVACIEQHAPEMLGQIYENPAQFDEYTMMDWITIIRKTLEVALDDWFDEGAIDGLNALITIINGCIACIAQHGLYERPLM